MIRCGVIGFGLHAVRRLMPGFAMATNSRVTALSRRNLREARQSAAEYKILHAFDSATSLCRCTDVDAVFVATPNSSHLHNVIVAIGSGKSVLCEKPMGLNSNECSLMVAAARTAKVVLGVAQIFRFAHSINCVAAGQIGKPVLARVFVSWGHSDPVAIELRRGAEVVDREVVWKTDAYARQIDAFSAALEGGLQFPVPGEEGWQNQEVVDAAYRSAGTGKIETVRTLERTK